MAENPRVGGTLSLSLTQPKRPRKSKPAHLAGHAHRLTQDCKVTGAADATLRVSSYPAWQILSWIDPAQQMSRYPDLTLSTSIALSLLRRNPPSIVMEKEKIFVDGDVARTYLLLNQLDPLTPVEVVHISSQDPLSGLAICVSDVISSYDRRKQMAAVRTLMEISEGSNNFSDAQMAKALGISPTRVCRLKSEGAHDHE